MDNAAAAQGLADALRAEAVPGRAEKERAYLKSDLQHYGASMPAIHRVALAFARANPSRARADLLDLVARLWASRVHEQRMLAVELLTGAPDRLDDRDMDLLETLLREARTWALVDPLAVEVVGPILEAHPEVDAVLERWARDDDHWLRRAVLLAHLRPMRRGDRDVFASFARYAEDMLDEREFFIRKALGWVLRERAKACPDEVFAWLLERRQRASGLTLREASKHLPAAERGALLVGRSVRRR